MKKLTESILSYLKESSLEDYDIDSDSKQAIIDVANSYSSSHNHMKYKYGTNMDIIFENGVRFKFILNDDSEYEYYVLDKEGKKVTDSTPVFYGLSDEAREFPKEEV